MRSARVLMVLLLITGIACRRTQKKIIGVVPQGQSHIFWQSIHAGALAAGAESGVEVEWNGPPNEGDPDSEIKVVDAMINRRLDAICLAPADEDAMVGVVERAAREKIPVIIFDTGVDTDAYVSRVATDNYGAGEIAARRMGVILRGKGRVVMLAVQPGIASSMAREQGFEDAIHREFPGTRIVTSVTAWRILPSPWPWPKTCSRPTRNWTACSRPPYWIRWTRTSRPVPEIGRAHV